jgi:hypothetical protein
MTKYRWSVQRYLVLSSTTDESANERGTMFSEPIQIITICVLVFTLLAVVVTCETLTRKAQLRHTANHYTTQLNTLGTATQELLQAFNTVTADRDALRTELEQSKAHNNDLHNNYTDIVSSGDVHTSFVHVLAHDACELMWAVCEDGDIRESVLNALHSMRDVYSEDIATPALMFVKYLHEWNNDGMTTNYNRWPNAYA